MVFQLLSSKRRPSSFSQFIMSNYNSGRYFDPRSSVDIHEINAARRGGRRTSGRSFQSVYNNDQGYRRSHRGRPSNQGPSGSRGRKRPRNFRGHEAFQERGNFAHRDGPMQGVQEDRQPSLMAARRAIQSNASAEQPLPRSEERERNGLGKSLMDSMGANRKRRKRIKGGAIPKFEKAKEFDDDLYCPVCEQFFDASSKAQHDLGREHQRNVMFTRSEQLEGKLDPSDDDVDLDPSSAQEPGKDSAAEAYKERMEAVKNAFLTHDKSKWPQKFREWAERSIAEAQRAAKEKSDPEIPMAVMREIVTVFKDYEDKCLLRVTNWTAKNPADGKYYGNKAIQKTVTMVIRDSQLASSDQPQNGAPSENHRGPSPSSIEENDIGDADPAPPTDWPERENVSRAEEFGEAGMPRSTSPINTCGSSAPALLRPYEEIPLRSTRCREAEELLHASRCTQNNLVCDNYFNCFTELHKKVTSKRARTDNIEGQDVPSLIFEYKKLIESWKSGEYEYETLHSGLNVVIKGLEARGARMGTVQHCLQVQISAALQQSNLFHCVDACTHLLEQYHWTSHLNDLDHDFIGLAVISLLYRRPSAKKSLFLDIATQMRKVRPDMLHDNRVFVSFQLLRAFVSNDWCSFFRLLKESRLHMNSFSFKRSEHIMEGLVDVIRERALITMLQISEHRDAPIYYGPTSVPLDYVTRVLGWDIEATADRDISLRECCDFISSCPQNFNVTHPTGVPSSYSVLKATDETAFMGTNDDIDVSAFVKWSGGGCKIVEHTTCSQ